MSTYQVTAYPVAKLPVPGWECFFGRNDTTFHNLFFYIWIVKDGEKTVLVDTGPPSDEMNFEKLVVGCQSLDERSKMTRIRLLEEILEEADVSPGEIDIVLITQTITYHTGCLLPRHFPRAEVYLSRQGIAEFLLETPGHPPRDLYFTEDTWGFLWKLLVLKKLHLVDDPVEVLPGIIFETTGGHHPGSAGVKIRTPGGTVSILETAFLKENIDKEIPIGIAENASLCREVIKRYKRESDLVLAVHDNSILDRFEGGVIRIEP